MNIKALIKSLMQRKFFSSLLLFQLALTLGIIVNSIVLSLDTSSNLDRDTGIPLDSVLVIELSTTSAEFDDNDFYGSILEQDLAALRNLDGVRVVSPHIQRPLSRGGWHQGIQDINEVKGQFKDEALNNAASYYTTPDGIAALGLEIAEGRGLTWEDEITGRDDNDGNIVVTDAIAKRLYPEGNALGQLTTRGRIVGITKPFVNKPHLPNDRQYAFFIAARMLEASYGQYYVLNVDPSKMTHVRKQVRDVILANHPERDIRKDYTMREHYERYYEQDIGLSKLFLILCGLMVLITAVSSYAHAQFHMAKQTRIIGIRRALGAKRADILLYVLTENWLMTALAGVLGIALVVVVNMLLAQQIELSKPSIALYFMATLVVFISGTVATWLPALKTSRIPPVVATRTV